MNSFINMLIENKPTRCSNCNGRLYFLKEGRFYCRDCGNETLDDLGKVKRFLKKNGEHPVMYIAQGAGVNPEIVEFVIREGNEESEEILMESRYYLSCRKCGCSIRSGNYCGDCTRELAGDIRVLLREDMPIREAKLVGKMHIMRR